MSPPRNPDDAGRVPELDGLRGLAVLLVFLCHAYPPPITPFTQAYAKVVVWGVAGVDLFFVLSGFLITGILLRAKDRPAYYTRFYGRRALRIFPLYFAVLLGVFVGLPLCGAALDASDPLWRNQAWLWGFAGNIPMCTDEKAFSSRAVELAHFWSLAVEEHFYLVWPVVVRVLSRRWLARACGGLIVVGLASRAVGGALTGDHLFAYHFSLCRFDALAAGALVAVAGPSPRFAPWRDATRRTVGVLSAAGLAWMAWKKPTWVHCYFSPGVRVFGPLALTGLGCYLVLAAAHARPGSPARRLLRLAPLRTLGTYSYALYVFSVPVIVLLSSQYTFLAVRLGTGLPSLLVYLVELGAVTFALAWLSGRLLEGPCLRLKDRLFSDHVSTLPAAPEGARPGVLSALFARMRIGSPRG